MLERARGCERFDLIDGGAGATHEVFEVGVRLHRAFVVDAIEQRVVQTPYGSQTEAHCQV
jgi:hypothetical protein